MRRLTITAPRDDYDQLGALLVLSLPSGWQEADLDDGRCQFIVHCEDRDFLAKLAAQCEKSFPQAALLMEEVLDTDWLSSWKEFFTPVLCGQNYVILPPWLAGEAFAGRRAIVIDPKSAFGTGHHASTVLCLTALDELLAKGRLHAGQNFLDLGCGTAVLGIGAALAGMTGLCVDIDPLAVANARENSSINKVDDSLEILEGSVENLKGRSFDLIMANILARPLIDMAPELCSCLAVNGCLILSGILVSQAEEVSEAYRKFLLSEAVRLTEGEWCALVWS